MSWKTRLRPGIVLVSPLKNSFTAKWRGDDVVVEKRVSRHAHPDQDFEVLQDLGLKSPDFPLTLFFDGPDHDVTARRFAECMAERGPWSVTHPVYGLRALQPVKITIKVHPAESGNVTEIGGEWFEPAGETASAPDVSHEVETAVKQAAEAAIEDAKRIDNIVKEKQSAMKAAVEQFKKGYQAAKGLIKKANKRITGITDTINDYTNRAALEAAEVSGAVIQLAMSPGLFLGNCASRVSMFVKLGKRIITDLPAAIGFSAKQIAAACSGELWLSAIACGLGTAIVSAPPETRAEALSVLAQAKTFFSESKNALDALASASRGNQSGGAAGAVSITDQYTPGAASTEALPRLQGVITKYLLASAYSLKYERRITLDRDRSPLEITVTELGANSGDFDRKYADFCRWNSLNGKRLLLLHAGEEVVVYG